MTHVTTVLKSDVAEDGRVDTLISVEGSDDVTETVGMAVAYSACLELARHIERTFPAAVAASGEDT